MASVLARLAFLLAALLLAAPAAAANPLVAPVRCAPAADPLAPETDPALPVSRDVIGSVDPIRNVIHHAHASIPLQAVAAPSPLESQFFSIRVSTIDIAACLPFTISTSVAPASFSLAATLPAFTLSPDSGTLGFSAPGTPRLPDPGLWSRTLLLLTAAGTSRGGEPAAGRGLLPDFLSANPLNLASASLAISLPPIAIAPVVMHCRRNI